MSIAPGAICIGGAFLLNFGMAAAMVTFFSGLFLGLGNSMLPLFKHHQLTNLEEQDLQD